MTSRQPPTADPAGPPPACGSPDCTLAAWEELIGDLDRELLHAEDDDPTAGASIHARWQRLYDGLVQLKAYYDRVPEETARYSDDEVFLRKVALAAARRTRLVEDLLAALERV
jgi:hypothetical protein